MLSVNWKAHAAFGYRSCVLIHFLDIFPTFKFYLEEMIPNRLHSNWLYPFIETANLIL